MSEKKYHIAIISTWFPFADNSSGIFVRDQADAMITAGHKVSVFMFQYFSPFEWAKKALNGEPLFKWNPGKYFAPYSFNYRSLKPTRLSHDPLAAQKKDFLNYVRRKFSNYIASEGKPDLIHHHGIANYAYITAFLSKEFQIPFVITEHSMFTDHINHHNKYETQAEQIEMLRNASARITVSNYYKEFNEELFGAPFTVIPNMINNEFTEPPLPSFPKTTKPFVFLNAGQLTRRKRQDILIRSFAKAFKGNNDVQLMIVGTGELESSLKKIVSDEGIIEQVVFAGFKDRPELIRLLDAASVCVVSSEKESFSMVAAESMFRGNPVLSTRCKGPEEFINDSNGLLCEVNDIDDMAAKLREIHSRYPNYNNLDIAKYARIKFSEGAIIKQLEELYSTVAG